MEELYLKCCRQKRSKKKKSESQREIENWLWSSAGFHVCKYSWLNYRNIYLPFVIWEAYGVDYLNSDILSCCEYLCCVFLRWEWHGLEISKNMFESLSHPSETIPGTAGMKIKPGSYFLPERQSSPLCPAVRDTRRRNRWGQKQATTPNRTNAGWSLRVTPLRKQVLCGPSSMLPSCSAKEGNQDGWRER